MSNLEKKILAEINLDHESLNDGVKHLEDWLKKQPHLPNVSDDQLLKAFIIGSKSTERAKEKLDKYFTARSKYPEVFANRDPLTIAWNQVEDLVALPGLTPEGSAVYLIIPPSTKETIEAFSFVETCRAGYMLMEYELRHQPFTSSGQYLIIDGKYASAELLLKFITSFTASAFDIYQNSMPIRMKGFICFNVTPVAEKIMNLFKSFFSSKLQKRVYILSGDQTSLSQYFPLDMLPEEYGGKNSSVKQLLEKRKKSLESDRDWFVKEGIQKADLSKRPNNEINDGDNVQGTFRKLQID